MTQKSATAKSAAPPVPMTAGQRAAFERDGYLIIRSALCPMRSPPPATRSAACHLLPVGNDSVLSAAAPRTFAGNAAGLHPAVQLSDDSGDGLHSSVGNAPQHVHERASLVSVEVAQQVLVDGIGDGTEFCEAGAAGVRGYDPAAAPVRWVRFAPD